MKSVAFFVQGEGHGHVTQALAVLEILEKASIKKVYVFSHSSKKDFFPNKKIEFEAITSPRLQYDKSGKFIAMKTLFHAAFHCPKYFRESQRIRKFLIAKKVELVFNFYEPLCGLIYSSNFSNLPEHIAIGHQYDIANNPMIQPGVAKALFNLYTNFTKAHATKVLELSLSKKNENSFGPLIRKAFLTSETQCENFILVYMTEKTELESLLHWCKRNPNEKVLCFSKINFNQNKLPLNFLPFKPNSDLFFKALKACKAFASTAGFESVVEAIILQKPVLIVPVKGHFEQSCNAQDFLIHDLCVVSNSFNLDPLLNNQARNSNFRLKEWVLESQRKLLHYLKTKNPEMTSGHFAELPI